MATTKSVKKNKEQQNSYMYGLYVVALLAVGYGAISWAIDSGSLFGYVLMFVCLYFAGHYTKLFIAHFVQRKK